MAAQVEDSDPCLLPTSGIVLLSESRYKLSISPGEIVRRIDMSIPAA